MKLNIKNSTIRKGYPVLCGLIVGGMTGGVMQSVFHFLLFGGLAWWFFRNEMLNDFQLDGIVSYGSRHRDNTNAPDLGCFNNGCGCYCQCLYGSGVFCSGNGSTCFCDDTDIFC